MKFAGGPFTVEVKHFGKIIMKILYIQKDSWIRRLESVNATNFTVDLNEKTRISVSSSILPPIDF